MNTLYQFPDLNKQWQVVDKVCRQSHNFHFGCPAFFYMVALSILVGKGRGNLMVSVKNLSHFKQWVMGSMPGLHLRLFRNLIWNSFYWIHPWAYRWSITLHVRKSANICKQLMCVEAPHLHCARVGTTALVLFWEEVCTQLRDVYRLHDDD